MGVWVFLLMRAITGVRPDLLTPGDLGSDSSNYIAAAERLAGGRDLYALSPGDRPTPADNPPTWSVPILSPPMTAVAWEWALLLPHEVAPYVSWLAALIGVVLVGFLITVRAPLILALASLVLFGPLAIMAWSGNVNGIVLAAAVGMWAWTDVGRSQIARAVIGAVLGVLVAVKLSPVFLVVWLVAQRRWQSVIAAVIAFSVVVAVALFQGGISTMIAYVDVIQDSASAPSAGSIQGLALGAGLPRSVATLAYIAFVALFVVGVFLLRRRPASAFAIALAAVSLGTPVVRPESLPIILGALAPWIAMPRLGARRISPELVGSVALAAMAVVLSIGRGGMANSTVSIANHTPGPITVRFFLPFQPAGFGFGLRPGESSVAWTDRGPLPGPAIAFDQQCQPIAFAWPPRVGGSLEIRGPGDLVSGPATNVGPHSVYSASCAGPAFDDLMITLREEGLLPPDL